MATKGAHIDFMFLGPPLTQPLDPLLKQIVKSFLIVPLALLFTHSGFPRAPPLSVHFLFVFMLFSTEKSCQNSFFPKSGWRPPPSGKSWIRHRSIRNSSRSISYSRNWVQGQRKENGNSKTE